MGEEKVVVLNKESISEKRFVELFMKMQKENLNTIRMDRYEICAEIGKLVTSSKEPLEDLKYIARLLEQFYNVFQPREEYEFKKVVGVIR